MIDLIDTIQADESTKENNHKAALRKGAITSYDDLLNNLYLQQITLSAKAAKTEKMRYLSRRLPLTFSFGFCFFALCLFLSTLENIGYATIHQFLSAEAKIASAWTLAILITPFAGLIFYIIEALGYTDFLHTKKTLALSKYYKVLADMVLISLPLSIFVFSTLCQHPLIFGITSFASLFFTSLLVEGTLGYTRENERNKLFAARAEGLRVLFASKEQASDTMLIEPIELEALAKFYEELRQSKYIDTVDNTHFVNRQLARFKRKK